jgi:hypothetical protein
LELSPRGARLQNFGAGASLVNANGAALTNSGSRTSAEHEFRASRSKGQQTKRLVKRLADLGYDVALTPLASYFPAQN